MIKKKMMVLCTTIMIAIGFEFAIPSVYAESVHDLQNQKEIQGQHLSIQAGISKANQEISHVQDELSGLNKQINQVDLAIQYNQNTIEKTEVEIVDTNSEIKQLKKELADLEDRIAKRNEVLKERAISYQESGGNVSYLEVLLGSASFSDLADRVGAVAAMLEADRDLLEQLEAEKREYENKQVSLEKKLTELTVMKTELKGMQAQIEEQQHQYDLIKEQLEKKKEEKIAFKNELQMKDRHLAATEQDLEHEANPAEAAALNMNHGANGYINTVISAGYKYIGNSVYVFGGGRTAYDVANGRFDCSGFVHWAFSQAGIKVGSSTETLKHSGRQISVSEMQPGDLVFFDTYKKDGHVGIYIGDGKFIGSQSSTGVAIADMSSGYWEQTFNGRVVRI